MLIILCVIIISLIHACGSDPIVKSDKIPVIDIESAVGSGQIINLSDIATEIRYIPLETRDSSLMSELPRIIYERGLFYSVSHYNIVIFDSCGRYMKTIDRRGRGPQEYNAILSAYIDPGTGDISMYAECPDQKLSVLTYSLESKLLSRHLADSIKMGVPNLFMKKDGNKLLFSYNVSVSDSVQHYATIFDTSGTVLKRLFKPKMDYYKCVYNDLSNKINDRGFLLDVKAFKRIVPHSFKYKKSTRFFFFENDTIFSLDSSLNYNPLYVFNYGKYKNIEEFDGKKSRGKHIDLNDGKIIETNNLLMMQFNLRDYAHEPFEIVRQSSGRSTKNTLSYAVYDKNRGKLTLMNAPIPAKPGFKEDFESGPPFFPMYISADMYAISLIYPAKLKAFADSHKVSPKLKSIADNLKEEDNPVIVIVKMK
ncbi:MAG: 6-bladed beta-propeller [Bacteroidales bacterium]